MCADSDCAPLQPPQLPRCCLTCMMAEATSTTRWYICAALPWLGSAPPLRCCRSGAASSGEALGSLRWRVRGGGECVGGGGQEPVRVCRQMVHCE